MSEAQPFQSNVDQSELDDLNDRLARTRWTDQLPGVGWSHGVNGDYLKDMVEYWRTEYDWRTHEAWLNRVPQFTAVIDGQNLHFLHARSETSNAIPLLLLHGWPSTVADFLPLLPQLTDPERGPAFDVVAPSLPGFGFSGPTTEPGWDMKRIARMMAELMRSLGYSNYLVQGGDFGSLLGPEIGRIDADHVRGVHTNGLITLSAIDWTAEEPLEGLSEEEQGIVYAAASGWEERSGYAAIQSTRPQTLAHALNDSPAGLLAWDLEWFVDYDPAASRQTAIEWDAILTDVTTTWLTGTAGSSARLYKEAGDAFATGSNSGVPTAVAKFPGDSSVRPLAELSHTIVRWTEYDRGGHFASLQAPDLLAEDIRAFADSLG